jgi:hypothetical protein
MSENMTADPVVWSCGGGTQSAAISALIVRGELPKPSAAIIADTGREASETWRYYECTLKPALEAQAAEIAMWITGFKTDQASSGSRSFCGC